MRFVTDNEAQRKRAKGQCLVWGCTRQARKRYKKPDAYCYHHQHELRKEKEPLKYWYAVLKRNAKRRHKVFTITLEDFKNLCENTGYLEKKGKGADNLSIDRIIDELGYIPGNVQILELGANSRKRYVDYWQRQKCSWQEPPLPQEYWEIKPTIDIDEEPPF